jgi:hypothetical protein
LATAAMPPSATAASARRRPVDLPMFPNTSLSRIL